MKPFKIIDESNESITYQYSPYYAWGLYVVLLPLIASMFIENQVLYVASGIAIVVFLVLNIGLSRKYTTQIKSAMKTGSVVVSGSKTSFTNPLTFVVQKNV